MQQAVVNWAGADHGDPARGRLFRGRLSEDFQLSTGTWVHVGPLRPRLLGHLAPLVQDVVIASEAGASSRSWCSRILGPRRRRSGSAWPASRAPAAPIASSAHILTEPPSLDAGEITDKGTINQRAVLARRCDLVDQLYCGPTASLFNA